MKMNTNRSGYGLLFLLLFVILAGLLIAFYGSKAKETKFAGAEDINNPPWQQWDKIESKLAKGGLGTPDSLQPKITETLAIKTDFFENKRDRGTIFLKFNPDYTIQGNWSGSFYIDPNKSREFQLADCTIRGYFLPDQTYADIENRFEPNAIYFLSKGRFTLVDYNYETNKTRAVKSYIFISGWLLPDFSIQQGQAIMTSDEEHFRTFTFLGNAEKMDIKKMFGLPK